MGNQHQHESKQIANGEYLCCKISILMQKFPDVFHILGSIRRRIAKEDLKKYYKDNPFVRNTK